MTFEKKKKHRASDYLTTSWLLKCECVSSDGYDLYSLGVIRNKIK